jgi:hypothetical protein
MTMALFQATISDLQKAISLLFNSQTEQVRFVARLKHVQSDVQKQTIIFSLVYNRQNFGEYGMFLFNEEPQIQLFECIPLNQHFELKLEDHIKGRFSVKYLEPRKSKTYIFEMPSDSMTATLFIIRKALHSIGRPHVALEKIFSRLDNSWEDNVLPPFRWISYINERFDLDHQEITFLNPLYQSFLGEDEVITSIKIIERDDKKKEESKPESVVPAATKKIEEEEDVELSDDDDKERIVLSSDDEGDIKDVDDDDDWN